MLATIDYDKIRTTEANDSIIHPSFIIHQQHVTFSVKIKYSLSTPVHQMSFMQCNNLIHWDMTFSRWIWLPTSLVFEPSCWREICPRLEQIWPLQLVLMCLTLLYRDLQLDFIFPWCPGQGAHHLGCLFLLTFGQLVRKEMELETLEK